MLQQHAEDSAAGDGMDDALETNHSPNGKIEFHDDSDEVWWIMLFSPLSKMEIDMSNFSCSPINKLQQEQRCGFMMGLAYQPH